MAKGLGVKIHSILNAAPDHVVYVIGKSDRPMRMASFVAQLLPTEQSEFRMNAVETFEDTAAFILEIGVHQRYEPIFNYLKRWFGKPVLSP